MIDGITPAMEAATPTTISEINGASAGTPIYGRRRYWRALLGWRRTVGLLVARPVWVRGMDIASGGYRSSLRGRQVTDAHTPTGVMLLSLLMVIMLSMGVGKSPASRTKGSKVLPFWAREKTVVRVRVGTRRTISRSSSQRSSVMCNRWGRLLCVYLLSTKRATRRIVLRGTAPVNQQRRWGEETKQPRIRRPGTKSTTCESG